MKPCQGFTLIKNTFLNSLVVFVIFSLVASWFYAGWPVLWRNPQIPPKIQEARATTRIIEQQINIIDQYYASSSATYFPTDNSLGLIRWDGTKYNGATVYFEAVIGTPNDASYTVYAALFDSVGNQVTGSEVSHTGDIVITRKRSGDITANLSNGTDYTVRMKRSSGSAQTMNIKAARLIVVQSDGTSITDTQTQVEVGGSTSFSSTNYATSSAPKIYLYDQNKFTPAPTAYFEATIKNSGQASSTVFSATTTVSISPYSWAVPDGVTSITVKAWGAGGGGGRGVSAGENGGAGGGGGFANGIITVSPGDQLKVYVGGGGGGGITADANGAGGGGLTGVFLTSTSTPLVIAGSGGGGGGGGDSANESGGSGGGGGGYAGTAGTTATGSGGNGGAGGTETAGGAGGTGGGAVWEDGQKGDASSTSAYYGGMGANVSNNSGGGANGGSVYGSAGGSGTAGTNDSGGGGGGGAGYHGGGGGEAGPKGGTGEAGGGGGGGSSYILNYHSDSGNSSTTGSTTAAGTVTGAAPAQTGDTDWLTPAGYGGNGGSVAVGNRGQPGRVVISYTLPATTTVALYTTGESEVSGSAVSTTSSSWVRVRSSAITLSDDTQYVVKVKVSATGATGSIANAKIILDQTAGGGIDAVEMTHQYINTSKAVFNLFYGAGVYDNYYDPADWAGGDFTYYFEVTINPYAYTVFIDLWSENGEIVNSEISTAPGSASIRQRSALFLTMPNSATTTDTRDYSAFEPPGQGPLIYNSWLVIQALNLTAAATISITRTVGDGIIAYGTVDLNNSTNTLPSAINDIETYQNSGTAAEKFSIKTSNATSSGVTWTVGTAAGSNTYVHSFTTTTNPTWQILNAADTYETASSSVGVNGTLDFYMKIDTPTLSNDYQQKDIYITVFAEAAS